MLNESRAKRAIVRCCIPREARHVPLEHRKFRRVHGLQLPLHPQQIVGWVLLIVAFVGTFAVLLRTPPLLPDLRPVLSLLFAALFLLHALTHLTVLLLDPADPEVRARPARTVVPEFDRAKHRHVIENGRCHLCNITTRGRRTKHCSICNKCVPRFDHHCKWLNNCIGGRNYPAFLVCLASTLLVALAVTALALGELVLVCTPSLLEPRWWGNEGENGTSMSNATATATPPSPSPSPVSGTGSLVLLVTVIGVLSAIAAVLLIHLCFFHGYIACLGLTTYEYVRGKRERAGIAGAGTTSTPGPCGMPCCTAADGEDIDRTVLGARDLCSRFRDNGPSLENNTSVTRMTMATTDVYVYPTHDGMANGKDVHSKTSPSIRGSRNFRLCFSYDSRTTETSIEVSSSRMTDAPESRNHRGESPDAKLSSTPSPVSCCFSIPTSQPDGNGRKRRPGESAKRSCRTMRRIRTFLQARLRKGSRQRSTTTSAIARCRNKIIPQPDGSPDITPTLTEDQDRTVQATATTPDPDYPRPPARLPALDISRSVRKIKKVSSSTADVSVLGQVPSSAISKRNQARRNVGFSDKKKPRFKIGSHVVTQATQLSPIPESEFSKPATPRSPSRSGSIFSFPPLHK